MKQFALCLTFAILLSSVGCSENVSWRQPFDAYAERTVTLEREAKLWRIAPEQNMSGMGTNREVAMESPPFTEMVNIGRDPREQLKKELVATLPAGTTVRIKSVKVTLQYNRGPVHALGRVELAGREPVEFEYLWGMMGELHRAPWEPEGVPAERRFDVRFR